MEIWKEVIGFEGYYQVSNLGNVKSLERYSSVRNHPQFNRVYLKEKILKGRPNQKNYLKVVLYKDTVKKSMFVHRLVCMAFLNNEDNLPSVNHIDENPKNNKLDNLEWCTNKYNNNHFIDHITHILKLFQKEIFVYEDKKFSFMVSAGLAFSGGKKMLAYADMALKDAKIKNIQIGIFNDDKELEKMHTEDIECHKQLLTAFDTNNVISYFQPISPIQDSSLPVKYESLVRLRLEDGSILPPIRFIDVAKKNRIYYKGS